MSIKHGVLLLASPFVLVLVLRARDSSYPRPELLVEPSQLARRSVAQRYVILDARERPHYEQGHVPSARWVDRVAWAAAFGHGQEAEGWSRRIGALGIGPASRVVVYDDNFSKDAALIWWILRYWGVADVRLLNGGWTGWTAGACAIDTGKPIPTPIPFVARARPERLTTKEQLLLSLKGGTLQIVDARSEKEYCGVERLNNKRAGTIPRATHLEWIDLLDPQTHRFKTAARLRQLFEQADIALDKPTAVYCQAGARAAVTVFGLELMGAQDVSNYYPSWAEWGNAEDTPVVPGTTREK